MQTEPAVEPTRSWWRSVVTDVRPLQVSAPYRRLFFGNTVAQLGQQMSTVAVAIQVYALTDSSFYVGLVGMFALVPLVVLGLYGGAIADAVDRRTLALVASAGLWAVSIALTAQAFAEKGSLDSFAGRVSDSGEGRWALAAANDVSAPTPVLATALFQRFASRGEADFQNRVLSAMRWGFGGHAEKS